jgi:hypothetical protein
VSAAGAVAGRAGAPALVACDLDGTLVDEAGAPCPRIAAALGALSAAGVRIVLCTGRTVAATRTGAQRLGLTGGYVVAYHGGVLADLADGRWLERLDLPAGVAPGLATALLRAGAYVTAYVDDERWEQWASPAEPTAGTAPATRLHADLGAALEGVAVTRLVVAGAAADLVADLAARHDGVAVSDAPGGRLEVHHAAADKAVALARLCARLGVSQAGAVACGDGAPDVGMLRWAGLGIAVAEGDAAARDAADLVVSRAHLPAALGALVGA